ncbi:MAG: lytic transglycosylase domain-containing protein [bacterium]|nr:lytic transglycosylase domain-containing protein [bacterium]
MRIFLLALCLHFMGRTAVAENAAVSQTIPEALVRRSYTPTYAQMIMARSTGRPYGAPVPETYHTIETPATVVIKTPSPLVADPPSTPAAKPAFSGVNLESDILDKIEQYEPYIRHYSRIHQLDPNLVRAVIYVESAGDPDAVSREGAMGLMQLMPTTADEMGVKSPYEPGQNIFGGTRYLSRMLEQFGSLDLALWAYNAGPEGVKRKQLPSETRRYIPKVMRIKSQLDSEGI